MHTRKLVITLGIIAILCIIGLIVTIKVYDVSADIVGEELTRLLIQVIVVIFIGQIVSIIIAEYNWQRQQMSAVNTYRKELLERILQLYLKLQSVRWKLKENISTFSSNPNTIRKAKIDSHLVDSQLQIVNEEIKLELYSIVEEIKIFHHVFSEWEELVKVGRIVHKYLDELVAEFRQQVENDVDHM